MTVLDSAKKVTDGDQLDDGFFNGISGIISVEAGENISAGNIVWIHLTNGKAYVGDTGTADDIRADGIALTTATTGNDVVIQTSGVYTTTGLTDKEDYYLGASGALSTTAGAVRIGTALSTTEIFLKIDDKRHGYVQEIKAWHKSITGGITQLSAYWTETAGGVLSDAESPLNGQTLPDLNTTQRFLRGSSTSGTTGGADTKDLTHTHPTSLTSTGGINSRSTYSQANTGSGGSATQDIVPAHMEVVWIMKIK